MHTVDPTYSLAHQKPLPLDHNEAVPIPFSICVFGAHMSTLGLRAETWPAGCIFVAHSLRRLYIDLFTGFLLLKYYDTIIIFLQEPSTN
jgi:hypothetical protein